MSVVAICQMDRGARRKSSGCGGQVALNLIRRVFGGGHQRGFGRYSRARALDGHGSLEDGDYFRSGCGGKWMSVEKQIEEYESSDDDGQEGERGPLKRSGSRPLLRPCFSSRWTSIDQYYFRRRKGFYCTRLRVVNMARLVAMIRKVRIAYLRMMKDAAASRTMLSLADVYSDIVDLIPVPCSKVRTIVVIRSVQCEPASGLDSTETHLL